MINPSCVEFGDVRRWRSAILSLVIVFGVASLAAPLLAQSETKGTTASSPAASTSAATTMSATGQPSEAEMMKMMMDNSKLNENHKLLAGLDGSWDYVVKMWMDGDSSKKPQESKGTATRKAIMDGRFVMMEVKGKFDMPGPDGKMMSMDFAGHGMEGYDNAKKKFVGTWMDNMGTGIMMSEGDYDAASKMFTFSGDYTMAPGMVQKIKETLKVPDKDHMTMEWYENRAGKEVKTMEIAYTRKK